MKKLNFLIAVLMISTMSFGQKKTVKLTIKENTAPCTGVGKMNCLQVLEEKQWVNFYDRIENFDYQPGYRYEITAIRTSVENPPADASAYRYELKKIVKKKEIKVEPFLNKKLVLSRMNGTAINKTSFYGVLDFNTQTFSGKSGCNQFNMRFDLNKNTISFHPGMSTMMACDPEIMKLEDEFLQTLGENPFKISYTENQLKLVNKNSKKKSLEFKIMNESDILTFINQKNWKLIMLDNVAKDYDKASIRFDLEENKVNGNSGCNNFFGSFSTNGDKISMPALATTRMACLDGDKSNTESKVLSYLSNENLRFDVADQTLNFYIGDRLVMMFGLVR